MNKARLIAAALMTAASLGALAQSSLTAAFAEAPQRVFPLLDRDARLDMIDYFQAGKSTASTNRFNGKSRITSLSPMQMRVSMTDASNCELDLLPTPGDTLVMMITTVKTPSPDSRMSVYSSDWESDLTADVFTKPVLADWVSDKSRRDEVAALLPFLLVSYAYDPATGVLTLTNNTKQFASADVYEIVAPALRQSLRYKWTGTKFKPLP